MTIVADNDGEKFEAVTDAAGRYEFRELPDGDYKVQPLLAPARRPAELGEMRHAKPGDTARVHRSILCGVRLDFLAQHAGVIAGRLEGPDGKPFDVSTATLWRFDKDAKFRIDWANRKTSPAYLRSWIYPRGAT